MRFAQGDPGGLGLGWEPGLGLACLCYAATACWGWLSLPAFPAQTQHCKFSSKAVRPLCPSSGSPFSDPPISLSIPSPERHLRPCWSSSTPKSARDTAPSCSCLPLQPCKGSCPTANPRPSGLLQQPCWVMEYVLLGFFLWPVQLPLYLGLNRCHLANEPILMF